MVLGAYLRYLNTVTTNLSNIPYVIYSSFFKIIILILFSVGIIYFLRSIRSGEYQQVELANIVDYDFARDDITKVRIELAATYKQVIDLNKSVLEIKSRLYDKALKFAAWGFIIFIVHFLIEEIIKYV